MEKNYNCIARAKVRMLENENMCVWLNFNPHTHAEPIAYVSFCIDVRSLKEWFRTIPVVVEHLVTPVDRPVIRSLEAEIIEFIIHVGEGE